MAIVIEDSGPTFGTVGATVTVISAMAGQRTGPAIVIKMDVAKDDRMTLRALEAQVVEAAIRSLNSYFETFGAD